MVGEGAGDVYAADTSRSTVNACTVAVALTQHPLTRILPIRPCNIELQMPGEPEQLRIYLLGDFRVYVGGRAVDVGAWRLRKAKSLVKLLALAPGHKLHRDQVLDIPVAGA